MNNPNRIRAEAAWGENLADWLDALVEECGRTSQSAAAKKLKVSTTVVTRILGNNYKGNVDKFADKVRGALLSQKVTCPVLGEIGRDRCIAEQGKKLSFGNPIRKRIHDACRAGCLNSRLGESK